MIEPAIQAIGLRLWGCEVLRQGKHSELRVYVDGDQGVTLDQCADVSRQIGAILDVEDPITGAYRLQVSSPGMDRSLFKPEQYAAYLGEQIKLRTRLPINGARNFTGVLVAADDTKIIVKCEQDEQMQLQFNQIEKANITPTF